MAKTPQSSRPPPSAGQSLAVFLAPVGVSVGVMLLAALVVLSREPVELERASLGREEPSGFDEEDLELSAPSPTRVALAPMPPPVERPEPQRDEPPEEEEEAPESPIEREAAPATEAPDEADEWEGYDEAVRPASGPVSPEERREAQKEALEGIQNLPILGARMKRVQERREAQRAEQDQVDEVPAAGTTQGPSDGPPSPPGMGGAPPR